MSTNNCKHFKYSKKFNCQSVRRLFWGVWLLLSWADLFWSVRSQTVVQLILKCCLPSQQKLNILSVWQFPGSWITAFQPHNINHIIFFHFRYFSNQWSESAVLNIQCYQLIFFQTNQGSQHLKQLLQLIMDFCSFH